MSCSCSLEFHTTESTVTEYLDGVTETVEEDLEDEKRRILKIPVYNTEDGISHSLSNLGAYRLIFMSIGSNIIFHFATNFLLRLFMGLRPQTFQRLLLMPSTLVRVV